MRVINRIKITMKKQTMKKKLFKTRLLSFAAFCGLALAFASCANEDVAQGTTGAGNENDKNLTTFVAGDEAKTRTSLDYNTGAFYWEAGDKIYVKDDDGTWQVSNNAPTAKVASFKFKVPGKFKNHTTYKVYYPGKSGNRNQVTIPAAQTQTTPNTTEHFGVSGDCGTADAAKQSNGSFAFSLDHKAAYLVFQPYTSNTVLKDCYLTKIEVSSDNSITHIYTLDPTTGDLTGTGSGKQIILTTKGSGSYANGFPLNTTSASVATNGAYMVIKPGTHTLKVRYWVKDVATNVEGTITKVLSSFNYVKNTYYDMTASLDVKDYDGDHYYMWDAQDQYWKGHEWNQGGSQPTLRYNTPGATTSNDYAQNNSDSRWYNEIFLGSSTRTDAQTALFKTLPNVNEMAWYALKGDPRWDADELWTTMGHLYKGGMWFKKKAHIIGFRDDKLPDGTDRRVSGTNAITNNNLTLSLPSASEANQFFYLPALGWYNVGKLLTVGSAGGYWSSSAYHSYVRYAFSMEFTSTLVRVGTMGYRHYGYRVQAFE